MNKMKLDINILFLLIPFLFGLFYDFTVYLMAVILIGVLIYYLIKNREIKLYFNYCFFSTVILTLFALLTCIWGVDKQDCIFGFFRILTVLLFVIVLMQQKEGEIKKYYNLIPLSGVFMVSICFAFRFIPNISEYFYSLNGRMVGFFQYSNTFALFLLIGITTLMYSTEKVKCKLLQIFILIAGILLTGSRTVFYLMMLVFGM